MGLSLYRSFVGPHIVILCEGIICSAIVYMLYMGMYSPRRRQYLAHMVLVLNIEECLVLSTVNPC